MSQAYTFRTRYAVALLAIAAAGCGLSGHDHDLDAYPSPIEELADRRIRPDALVESQTRGCDVYNHYCKICHGTEGQGDGFNAAMLDPSPRNFADMQFWQSVDDQKLTTIISLGGESAGKSVLMPAWGKTLTQAQIRDVVAYLHTIPGLVSQSAAEADEATQ